MASSRFFILTPHTTDWTVFLLSLMMVLVPGLGMPTEEVLQDTFKSILVCLFAILAGITFFWSLRGGNAILHLHFPFWLTLGLAVYGLGSIVWAHAYLASVEAVRWLILCLIVLIGSNNLTIDRVCRLAWGIHLGAVVACCWAALQFWSSFNLFPQGPGPASTFINRNIFAEYLVCTIPFSVYLLTLSKTRLQAGILAATLGLNMVALMMSGTRSALFGLLATSVLTTFALWRKRRHLLSFDWTEKSAIAVMVLTIVVVALGLIPTNNPKLLKEYGPINALERGLSRSLSVTDPSEFVRGSFSIRIQLWQATGRMIAANPIFGVGAGSWEVMEPLYQDQVSQVEIDYYVHNEVLQLIAEYGIAGGLLLFALAVYLTKAVLQTFAMRTQRSGPEFQVRTVALTCIMALFIVSNAGFPLHMATTSVLFALSLSILVASNSRLGAVEVFTAHALRLKNWHTWAAFAAMGVALFCALYVSRQAVTAEKLLIKGLKGTLMVAASQNPTDQQWEPFKAQNLRLLRTAIGINPHYRKLTPIAADVLASTGDWANAIWIWESVLESRPYVPAILANLARGYVHSGNPAKAQEYLSRALEIQPESAPLLDLQRLVSQMSGKEKQ